jgi:hypothetical protein
MDILIAILWYLQLLLPGQEYTETEIEQIYLTNQDIIEKYSNDASLTYEALLNYEDDFIDEEKSIIEEWEENPIKMKHD